MDKNLEKDLQKCLELISSKWVMQNNICDAKTNFIYGCKTLDECISKIQEYDVDASYALHRWYNFMTSVYCEYIFCEFGAVHEDDEYNHDIDIYIDNVPYDVKLTIYPAKLSNRPYNLKTQDGKNRMVKWYYKNQSQQSRKQLVNRIYVVCDGGTPYECLRMKSDFDLLRARINSFMEWVRENEMNELEVLESGKKYLLKSDIVYVAR